MRRARQTQLGVMLTIVDALETHRFGVTLNELAARTGLHQRSVRRYIDELEACGIAERQPDGSPPRWRSARTNHGTRLSFTLAECLALARCRSATLAHWRHASWFSNIESAFARVAASIPTQLVPLFDEISDVTEAAVVYPRAHERWRAELEDAARSRHVVALSYRGMSGGEGFRRYDPYVLYAADGASYVYGFDHKRNDHRVLALDRIAMAHVTGDTFELPASFSAARFVADLHHGYKQEPAVAICVRVSGRSARLWRDRPEYPDQQLEDLDATSIRVRFSAAHTPALVARLLSFGADLVVESPPPVRDAVEHELRRALHQYAANGPPKRTALRVDRPRDRRIGRK